MVSGGFGVASGISIVPTLAVLSLSPTTLAYIDQDAIVNAHGNVLVQATDNTSTDVQTGSLGVGFLNTVGTTLANMFVTKDTEAYVAAGATVNADAIGTAGITVYSGDSNANGFSTTVIHGVGVEAVSNENFLATVGSGAASLGVAVAGAMDVKIDDVTTKAHIDDNARINQNTPAASLRRR